jgi:hypothetical protein
MRASAGQRPKDAAQWRWYWRCFTQSGSCRVLPSVTSKARSHNQPTMLRARPALAALPVSLLVSLHGTMQFRSKERKRHLNATCQAVTNCASAVVVQPRSAHVRPPLLRRYRYKRHMLDTLQRGKCCANFSSLEVLLPPAPSLGKVWFACSQFGTDVVLFPQQRFCFRPPSMSFAPLRTQRRPV